MRLFAVLAAGLMLAGASRAGSGEAMRMWDGPGETARLLWPGWIMRCPVGESVVGLRLFEDDGATEAVAALCAVIVIQSGVSVWETAPSDWDSLEKEARAYRASRAIKPGSAPKSDGGIMHADSGKLTTDMASGSVPVSRISTSSALIISIARPPESYASSGTGRESARVWLNDAGPSRTLLCPRGSYVTGIKSAVRRDERGLGGVQIICGQGAAQQVIGAAMKQKAADIQQVRCSTGTANPLDGAAADALIGTALYGRVQSLGLTCKGDTPG